jgi:Ser/Thr protein kinase RdoA (MazF antagonist)
MTADIDACLRLFGLAVNGPVFPVHGGRVGHNVVAPTAQGPVVVKLCSARFESDRIRLATAAHEHAASAGLAPRLFHTLDGELFSDCAGKRTIVAEFIEPAPLPGLVAFASALADLHRHFESFAPAEPYARDFLQLPEPPNAGLTRLYGQESQKTNAAHIAHRLHLLQTVGLGTKDISGLSRPWIHGDAHPGNLLATKEASLILFTDFDQVSRFPRSYELLRAFFAFLGPDPDPRDAGRELRAYVAAYEANTPLTTTERAMMIDFFLTVQAAETRTFTTSATEVRGMPAYAEARHRRLAWLVDHHDALRRALETEES